MAVAEYKHDREVGKDNYGNDETEEIKVVRSKGHIFMLTLTLVKQYMTNIMFSL